jgi:hypothetical protein
MLDAAPAALEAAEPMLDIPEDIPEDIMPVAEAAVPVMPVAVAVTPISLAMELSCDEQTGSMDVSESRAGHSEAADDSWLEWPVTHERTSELYDE